MDKRRPGKELFQVKPLTISSYVFVIFCSCSVESLESLVSLDLSV